MNRFRLIRIACLLICTFYFAIANAALVDINAPTWRGDGDTTLMTLDMNNGVFDSESFNYVEGSFLFSGGRDRITICGGGCVGEPGTYYIGRIYYFQTPLFLGDVNNIRFRVQVSWDAGASGVLPQVIGLQDEGDANGYNVIAGTLLDRNVDLQNRYFYEDWIINSNEDFVTIMVFTGGENISSAVIDTISAVPIPPALYLFGSGLLVLIRVARKSHS